MSPAFCIDNDFAKFYNYFGNGNERVILIIYLTEGNITKQIVRLSIPLLIDRKLLVTETHTSRWIFLIGDIMYKKFYIAKMIINILLIGMAFFFIYFDVINYVIALMVLITITQVIFKFISKFKFENETVKTKNNILLNMIMLLLFWAGMYIHRYFLVASWLAYVFTEVFAYREAEDYFE